MAIRKILDITTDNTFLRRRCRTVERFDERLSQLIDDMRDTLRDADGAGLAAPQVGVLRRVALVDVADGEGVAELVNPVIVERRGEEDGEEACLSVSGRQGRVVRPEWVKVEAFDRFGKKFTIEGEGFKARAFCHEIDHLDGVLFIDLMHEETQPG